MMRNLLFGENYKRPGTFYALRAPDGRWLRGAKLWRWTRFLKCAAQPMQPGIFQLVANLPAGCRVFKIIRESWGEVTIEPYQDVRTEPLGGSYLTTDAD